MISTGLSPAAARKASGHRATGFRPQASGFSQKESEKAKKQSEKEAGNIAHLGSGSALAEA